MVSDRMREYMEYLERYCQNTGTGMWHAHQQELCRETGRKYGLTDAELEFLDNNL